MTNKTEKGIVCICPITGKKFLTTKQFFTFDWSRGVFKESNMKEVAPFLWDRCLEVQEEE